MPEIRVAGVLTGPEGVLLVRTSPDSTWALPHGPLLDTDESAEVAILRELENLLGLALADEPEFLETLYERMPDGSVVLHNLYHVPDLEPAALPEGWIAAWHQPETLASVALPDWLRQGLQMLFAEEDEEQEPEFDLAAFQAAVDRLSSEPVWIITGPSGAGKSTVARALCARYEQAAHINVDILRDFVVSGYVPPVEGDEPEEFYRQQRIAAANAAAIARNFARAGMVSVIDDVLETQDDLDHLLAELGPGLDLHFVTLMADAATLAKRDRGRPEDQHMGERSEELRLIFENNGETRGLRLDTSAWNSEETVDALLARTEESRLTAQNPT